MEWKRNAPSGDVLNRLETDVTNVVNFLTEVIPNSLSTLALFVGAFGYLFMMDWRLAIVIVIMIPIFILFSRVYVRQMRHLTSEVRTSDSKVQSILQETIQHRLLIKTLEGDSAAVDRLEDTQSVLRSNVVKRTKFSVFSYLVLNLGFSIGYLIAFTWAAVRLSGGTLTFGWYDCLLAIGKQNTKSSTPTYTSCASICVGFHCGRTIDGVRRKSIRRTGRAY